MCYKRSAVGLIHRALKKNLVGISLTLRAWSPGRLLAADPAQIIKGRPSESGCE